MIISNSNADDVTIKFDSAMIDFEGIIDDQHLHIPYKDKILVKALERVIYDIGNQNEWVYPDYQNVKMWLVVHGDISDPDEVEMTVEVKPAQFTEEERKAILEHASRDLLYTDIGGSDVTMYSTWLDIFEAIDDYYNCEMWADDWNGSCSVQMTKSELKQLQNAVNILV